VSKANALAQALIRDRSAKHFSPLKHYSRGSNGPNRCRKSTYPATSSTV